jgi:membrane-associated phospholipid phosphatase
MTAEDRRSWTGIFDGPTAGLFIRLSTCVLVLIYFQVGYKWGYRSHSGPGVFDAATPLDAWLPLIPEFIVFYMLGYLFVLVPCLVVRDRKAFYAATVVFCLMLALAFLFFRYLPIEMHKTYATGDDWFERLAYFQQSKDTPYNNFPSLHVALNVYAYALIAWQARRIPAWWLPWPLLIVVSTLLVKQHLVVDVVGGGLLAWAGFRAFRRLLRWPLRRVVGCYLVVLGGMVIVLLTHLERLGKTVRKVSRFLDAGGITPTQAAVAGLLAAGSAAAIYAFARWRRPASPTSVRGE